ncbi:unnamed protein product [Urochloa humidicola]
MGSLSVLLLDDNPTSLSNISNMLGESGFKVFKFQTVEMALDFVKSRAAIEEELDLVLAEVHLRNIPPGSLANSELLHHIRNELQVPLITMCAYDDEEAISELLSLGECSHVLKPLHTGSLNMLKKIALEHKSKNAIALEHKSKRETLQGPIPSRTKSRRVSSSTKRPQEMLIPEMNNLSNPGIKEFKVPEVRKAHGCSKKSGRIKWTLELHEMFLDAVEVLGDKHTTPQGIRKIMNVKGLTSKQIASHLQKHRLLQRNAKQGGKHKKNTSRKPVSEPIGSAHSAAATESITPTADADSRELYPLRLWAQVKEAAALKTCIHKSTYRIYRDDKKSMWDENNLTEAAGNNGNVENINLLEDTMNKEHPATTDPSDILAFLQSDNLDLIGPSEGRDEEISDWSELERLLDQQNLGLEDPLQVDNAWNKGLASPSLINIDGSMVQEATVQNVPVYNNPVMPIAQDDGFSQDQQNLGLEDLLQVDNAWNNGLALPTLINMDGSMAQEATVQNAPVHNPVMSIAQDDTFWSWSPPVGDFDMLL